MNMRIKKHFLKILPLAIAAAFTQGAVAAGEASLPAKIDRPIDISRDAAKVGDQGPGNPAVLGPVANVDRAQMTGTVQQIDRERRLVTIRSDDGRSVVMAAGPDVRNFENLKKGDRVDATFSEATALAVAKGGTGRDFDLGEIRTRVEAQAASQAPAGGKPGMKAMERTTLVANVFQIDRDRGILTLRGTSGEPVDVRASKEALKGISKDDQVVISYVQAAAVTIEPSTKSAGGGSSSQPVSGSASPSAGTAASGSASSVSTSGDRSMRPSQPPNATTVAPGQAFGTKSVGGSGDSK